MASVVRRTCGFGGSGFEALGVVELVIILAYCFPDLVFGIVFEYQRSNQFSAWLDLLLVVVLRVRHLRPV